MTLPTISKRIRELADKDRARELRRFFKTGPGEYGEGDLFLGIRVPVLRKLTRDFQDLGLRETEKLLHSKYHEERLMALLILKDKFSGAEESRRKTIYELYLGNTLYVNNWDLVDVSAEHIVGAYLVDKNRQPLSRLALSAELWERRIAIIATFHYIKNDDFSSTLEIAELLLNDNEDLIHKAVGWMLREVGKRDLPAEESFLKKHYRAMPRTMLRYAIEKLPESRRQAYLKGLI